MGFDFSIMLNLMIDENTGLPFVLGNFVNGDFVKPIPYNPSDYIVPEKYRKWLQAHGRHFHAYIQLFHSETTCVSIHEFYDSFPFWNNVCSILEDDEWTEQDHNEFKEAIDWFYKHDCFLVRWSY